MRHKPEYLLIVVMSIFALAGVVASVLDRAVSPTPIVVPIPIGLTSGVDDERDWFQSIRAHCNPEEVERQLGRAPAPATAEGRMQEAACYALAGRIDLARLSIEALPADQRSRAAHVVFVAGHPAADAGDEIAAGPLMELVVEYAPDNHMALYHAGAARFQTGSHGAAATYLRAFLARYSIQDAWRSSALSMLDRIEGR